MVDMTSMGMDTAEPRTVRVRFSVSEFRILRRIAVQRPCGINPHDAERLLKFIEDLGEGIFELPVIRTKGDVRISFKKVLPENFMCGCTSLGSPRFFIFEDAGERERYTALRGEVVG